jgi:hypothetical protein
MLPILSEKINIRGVIGIKCARRNNFDTKHF